MGREASRWILLGCLSWMGLLLLATLKAWGWGRGRSWARGRGRSLGGGRCVVLKLLLLLWRARLRGSGLRAVSCRVLHTILLLLLRWGTWLLVSTWSPVLLVHLTIHASWGSLLYSRIGSLWLGGCTRLRCRR